MTLTEIAGGAVAVTITGDGGMWTVRVPMPERYAAASVLAAVDGTVTLTRDAAQTALAFALSSQGKRQPAEDATAAGWEQLAQVDDALGRPFHVRDYLASRRG